jgi:hypothetical protein
LGCKTTSAAIADAGSKAANNTAQRERKRVATVVLRERLPTLLFFDIAYGSLTASSADLLVVISSDPLQSEG